jgi:hypothetical protein
MTTFDRPATANHRGAHRVGGTAAMVRAHPLSRMRRDVEALAAHIAVNGATIEAAGKMRAGLIAPDIRV